MIRRPEGVLLGTLMFVILSPEFMVVLVSSEITIPQMVAAILGMSVWWVTSLLNGLPDII